MNTVTKAALRLFPAAALCLVLVATPPAANAMPRETAASIAPQAVGVATGEEAMQQRGMSLSDAVDSVRRRGNVERVISAETRYSGGREIHYVKVLTKDGKVRTHKIPGRRGN